MKTRVLIVDDSALARDMIAAALARADDIDVVGMAADPLLARRQIALLHPDVLTLDVEMPRMDGLSFLEQVMRLRPMPVVMVSSVTQQGSVASLQALALGAVDVVEKPVSIGSEFEAVATDIVTKIRLAGQARIHAFPSCSPLPVRVANPSSAVPVVVAAGEGGIQAMTVLMASWPAGGPPLVLVPTAPVVPADDLAMVLNDRTAADVRAATSGQRLEPGQVVVLTSAQRLKIGQDEDGHFVLRDDDADDDQGGHVADRVFSSLAETAGVQAVGVLLTGAGLDGATGLAALVRHGGTGLLQDHASSMFHALAEEALRLGGGYSMVPLGRMTREILAAVDKEMGKTGSVAGQMPDKAAFGLEY